MSSSPDARSSPAARLMADILAAAGTRGWSQAVLAERAGVPDSSISRIKRTGRADLDTLARLAAALGLRLTLVPDHDFTERVTRGDLF
jgi:transcriptional regulator with XRE-family HTH domain